MRTFLTARDIVPAIINKISTLPHGKSTEVPKLKGGYLWGGYHQNLMGERKYPTEPLATRIKIFMSILKSDVSILFPGINRMFIGMWFT